MVLGRDAMHCVSTIGICNLFLSVVGILAVFPKEMFIQKNLIHARFRI
jgi:hypothetical protein